MSPSEYAATEQERHDEQTARWISSGIPPRFAARVDLPGVLNGWALMPRSLYLTGPTGTGKTHAAFECLRRLREAGTAPTGQRGPRDWMNPNHPSEHDAPDALVIRSVTLLDNLRPDGPARDTVAACQRAGLLVISDLGAEKASDWTQERIYEVIDERYEQERMVIVTGNIPPAKLGAHIGERSASRLAEMCQAVVLGGQDRRR